MATKDPRLARAGVSGYNKPKRTPSHPLQITPRQKHQPRTHVRRVLGRQSKMVPQQNQITIKKMG